MDSRTRLDVYAVMRIPAIRSWNDVPGVANSSSCDGVRNAISVWCGVLRTLESTICVS